MIRDNGTKVIRLPPMSPNLNAYAERFVRSIKEECLDRMIFVGVVSRNLNEVLQQGVARRAQADGSRRMVQRARLRSPGGLANDAGRVTAPSTRLLGPNLVRN